MLAQPHPASRGACSLRWESCPQSPGPACSVLLCPPTTTFPPSGSPGGGMALTGVGAASSAQGPFSVGLSVSSVQSGPWPQTSSESVTPAETREAPPGTGVQTKPSFSMGAPTLVLGAERSGEGQGALGGSWVRKHWSRSKMPPSSPPSDPLLGPLPAPTEQSQVRTQGSREMAAGPSRS